MKVKTSNKNLDFYNYYNQSQKSSEISAGQQFFQMHICTLVLGTWYKSTNMHNLEVLDFSNYNFASNLFLLAGAPRSYFSFVMWKFIRMSYEISIRVSSAWPLLLYRVVVL